MMAQSDWQPTTTRQMLDTRADLLRQIRLFFAGRGVLEVETPILSRASGTDPHLDPVRACLGERPHYLQTSPEFAMKRLLAAGSGPIYQVARSFRHGEAGQRHNPEFTMLEWYRPGFTLAQLMDEVDALVEVLLGLGPATRIAYRQLFRDHLGIDPFTATLDELATLATSRLDLAFASDNTDDWLDVLFSHCLEPKLQAPVFIVDYPASQAALARIEEDADGMPVARRFELVAGGMELANGYFELADPAEQRRRFDADLARRAAGGLPPLPVDERLLAALDHGLPECCGVAVGLDRLLMLKTSAASIRDVIPFPVDIA